MTDPIPVDEEVPKAPGTLDFFAKFGLAINDLTEQVKRANRIEQAKLEKIPNYVPLSRMSAPVGTTDIIDFGGPQPGRQWVVQMIAGISSPIAANAAVVTWYIGQVMAGPAAGELPATMARWQFASIPRFERFGSDTLKILPHEHLIAGLTGVPALSQIALTAIINDLPLGMIVP